MTTHSFDALIDALSSSVSDVQKSLTKKQCGELRRVYSDESGKALTWTFYVPSGDGCEEHYTPIEIPLLSLRSNYALQLTQLSVEFDCDLQAVSKKEIHGLTDLEIAPAQTAGGLVMRLCDVGRRCSKLWAHIKIRVAGRDELNAEVSVNGRLLKKIQNSDYG